MSEEREYDLYLLENLFPDKGRVYPVKDHSVFLKIIGAISYLCAVSIIGACSVWKAGIAYLKK